MLNKYIEFLKPRKNTNNYFEELVTSKNVEGMISCIDRLPNPDIILRKAGKKISVLQDLTNHYQIGTCIDSRKSGTLKKLWKLKCTGIDDKTIEFYNNIFNNIDIYTLIENILDTPLFGYNVLEINWKDDNGNIVPETITAKPQDWFFYDRDKNLRFKHKDFRDGIKINDYPYKFLVPRNKPTYNNPYGQAILSRCFWNAAFINGGMEFWVKFTEKYGMPFMVGKYEKSMSDSERKGLLNTLVQAVQDVVAVIPNDSTIDVIGTGTTQSTDIYASLIEKCEKNIAKSILGQTLTTDVGNIGSYAAANTHNLVRYDIIESDTRLVEKTINELIRYINDINFQNTIVPKFILFEEEKADKDTAERDLKLYSAGVRFSKKYFMRQYALEDDDFTLK